MKENSRPRRRKNKQDTPPSLPPSHLIHSCTNHSPKKKKSLPQTRLHFQEILSGFTPADRTSSSNSSSRQDCTWPTDTTPHNPLNYFHSHLAAAGLETPLGGEGRRKCSSTGGSSGSGAGSGGKGKERERGREGRGSLGVGRESPRGSFGGEGGSGSGSGRKKRRSGAGVGA